MTTSSMRLGYFHVLANMVTGNRAFRGDDNSPAGFLTLNTTGRKSGQPRSSHLLYIRDGADYVVTASYGGGPRDPGWLFNVRSNPQVTIEAHGRQIRGVAEVAPSEKRNELWARLMHIAPLYDGYRKRTTRTIQMVIIHPEGAAA